MSEVKFYWKESPIMLGLFAMLIVGLTFAVFDSFVVMADRWSRSEEYGYAYMIPVITGYFIWQNKILLQQAEYKLSLIGGLLLIFSFFIILLGILSATHSITQYGYILSIVSTAFFFLGWNAFKIIAAPMLLLFLVVPLPTFIFNNLSSELQLISSQIGVWVIRAFGISVFLEGNVIDLGKFQLQVVEACSGLRYLFPLVSLSIIAAFIFKVAIWKRAVIVVSSIPITVLMNSFRIGVIGILVEYGGIEQAEGFLHDFEGWIVFMACVGLLLLEMWLLVSFGSAKKKLSEVFAFELPDSIPSEASFKTRKVSWKYWISTLSILTICIVLGSINERAEIIPDRTTFSQYPLQFGKWSGNREKLRMRVLNELKLDDYYIADFSKESGVNVNLYMAYYQSQRSGAAAHSPRSCIPGGGWRIRSHTTLDILEGKISTNRLVIQKGEIGQLVYYWFDQRGRDITNEYMVKWYLFWDSLTQRRTDGALVRLTTTIKPGEDVAIGDKRLLEFASLIEPTLYKYIPE